MGNNVFGRVTADTIVQQVPEGALVGGMLVNVRNTELGLPEESMVGALENLTLLAIECTTVSSDDPR